MRRGVAVTPMEIRRDVIVRAATLADELGYEVFSVAEGWGLDATVLLAELAVATRRITLAAGVLSVWGRSPATIAMTAATLHRLSGGRFVLGLGASTRQLVEGWHDIEVRPAGGPPAGRHGQVRALLNGERAALSAVPGARALRLGQPPVPDLPIWLAATGERTIRVAADLADGWYPLYLRRDRVRELGAGMSGRDRRRTRSPSRPGRSRSSTRTSRRPGRPRRRAPRRTWRRWATSIPAWSPARASPPRSTSSAPRRTIPAEAQVLLDEFTAYGTAATVREQLERWDDAVDITMVGLPPGLPWPQIEATIRACAPQAPPG